VSDKITQIRTVAEMISSTIAAARITFPIIVILPPEPRWRHEINWQNRKLAPWLRL